MSDYDQQISDNIKELDRLHKQLSDLAEAFAVVNQTSSRTYGLSIRFKPQPGIYCIENGVVKSLSDIYEVTSSFSIDKVKDFKLISSEKKNENKKLKITYANNKSIIID